MSDISFSKYIDRVGYQCVDYEDSDIELYTCDTGNKLIVIMYKNGNKVYQSSIKAIEKCI